MTNLTRFGVSLDGELLEQFDGLIRQQGYANRSEAIRDLIRSRLVETEWDAPDREVFGAVFLVYDHHVMGVNQRLTDLQHGSYARIISTVHVHIDHHNCLEIIVMKGGGTEVRRIAEQLISLKGVKYGRLNMGTTGGGI